MSIFVKNSALFLPKNMIFFTMYGFEPSLQY